MIQSIQPSITGLGMVAFMTGSRRFGGFERSQWLVVELRFGGTRL